MKSGDGGGGGREQAWLQKIVGQLGGGGDVVGIAETQIGTAKCKTRRLTTTIPRAANECVPRSSVELRPIYLGCGQERFGLSSPVLGQARGGTLGCDSITRPGLDRQNMCVRVYATGAILRQTAGRGICHAKNSMLAWRGLGWHMTAGVCDGCGCGALQNKLRICHSGWMGVLGMTR